MVVRKRIGILGGSFNPPHFGHLQMSLYARKFLHVHEIWWIPTIGNPLKNNHNIQPFAHRVQLCQQLCAKYHYISIKDIEYQQNIHRTIDVISYLYKNFAHEFLLLMGADCYHQLPLWQDYSNIIESMPIAVFMRQPFNHFYQKSPVYKFPHHQIKDKNIQWWKNPPAICRIPNQLWRISSSQIRGN